LRDLDEGCTEHLCALRKDCRKTKSFFDLCVRSRICNHKCEDAHHSRLGDTGEDDRRKSEGLGGPVGGAGQQRTGSYAKQRDRQAEPDRGLHF